MVGAHRRHKSLPVPSHPVGSITVDAASDGCSSQHSQQEQVRSSALLQHLGPFSLHHLHLAQAQEAAVCPLPLAEALRGHESSHSGQEPGTHRGSPCSPQPTAEVSPPWGSAFVAVGAPMPRLCNSCNCVGFHF